MTSTDNYRIVFLGDLIAKSVNWIKSIQNTGDGGFPVDREGSISGLWTSAGLMLGLSMAGESFNSESMKKGLAYLISQRNLDNGFTTHQKGQPSSVDPTCLTIMVLAKAYLELGRPDIQKHLVDTLDWLIKNRKKDGSWSFDVTEKEGMTISTSYAIMALSSAKEALANRADLQRYIDDGLKWLLETQERGKGWGVYGGNPSKSASTAYSLIAFAESKTKLDPKLLSTAVEFLCETQRDDGSWPDVIERHFGESYIRFSTPYCIIALVRTGCEIASNHFYKCLSWILRNFKDGMVQYEDSDIYTYSTRDVLLAATTIYTSLTMKHVANILADNIRLIRKEAELQELVEFEKEQTKKMKEEMEQRISARVNARIGRAEEKFNLFKQISILLLLSIGILFTLMFSSVTKLLGFLTDETVFVVMAIWIAVWGVYVALIQGIKLDHGPEQ